MTHMRGGDVFSYETQPGPGAGPAQAPCYASLGGAAAKGALACSSGSCWQGGCASGAMPPYLVLQQMEDGWYGAVVGGASMEEEGAKGQLLPRKRSPSLTWWLEGARAVGAVTLLPLLACTPFRTSLQQQPPN